MLATITKQNTYAPTTKVSSYFLYFIAAQVYKKETKQNAAATIKVFIISYF